MLIVEQLPHRGGIKYMSRFGSHGVSREKEKTSS